MQTCRKGESKASLPIRTRPSFSFPSTTVIIGGKYSRIRLGRKIITYLKFHTIYLWIPVFIFNIKSLLNCRIVATYEHVAKNYSRSPRCVNGNDCAKKNHKTPALDVKQINNCCRGPGQAPESAPRKCTLPLWLAWIGFQDARTPRRNDTTYPGIILDQATGPNTWRRSYVIHPQGIAKNNSKWVWKIPHSPVLLVSNKFH